MSSKTLGELDEDLVRQGYLPADRVARCAHAGAAAAAADSAVVEGATAAAMPAIPEAQGAAAAAAAAAELQEAAAAAAAIPEAQGAAAAAAVPKVQAPGAAAAAVPRVQEQGAAAAAVTAAASTQLRRIEQEERSWCCCAIGTEFHQQPYTFVARGPWTSGYQSLLNDERFLPHNPDRIPLKYISVAAGSRGSPQDYQGC